MYTKTVRLPYTLWYDGKDKTFRMDMSSILPEEHYEDGKKYIGKIRNVQVGGYNVDGDIHPPKAEDNGSLDVSEFATAVYNEQKHYVDITLKSFPSFNADGEIALYINYELAKGIEEYLTDYSYKKEEVHIIIPIRSHENPSKDPGQFNNGIGIDKLDARNGFAHTVGANEEPIVFSFELIQRDITDEFITNGQALDMVKNKAVEHVSLTAKDSGLELSLNYNKTGNISWDNLKQYLGGSNPTEHVVITLEDVLSMLDSADLNNNNRLTSIIALGLTTNVSVRENGSKDIDVNFATTYYDSQGNNPTTRNFTLFTIPRSLLGGEGGTVDTESIKNSILSAIQQQLPNAATIKQEILADVNPRIPDKESLISELREATGGAITLDSILEALKDDTKENVLTQIKEKLSIVNTDTLKHELLNALPAKDDYALSYDGVSLYLTKTNDSSYMKSVQITPEINIDKINTETLTSKLKPELDKSYYSKQEVDQLIQQLKHELMPEDHSEEHPQ